MADREDHESESKMETEDDDAADTEPGAFESLTIRKAEGGFIATCSRRTETGGGGSGAVTTPWIPPKDYVFASKAKLFAYIKQELGDD